MWEPHRFSTPAAEIAPLRTRDKAPSKRDHQVTRHPPCITKTTLPVPASEMCRPRRLLPWYWQSRFSRQQGNGQGEVERKGHFREDVLVLCRKPLASFHQSEGVVGIPVNGPAAGMPGKEMRRAAGQKPGAVPT